MPTDATEAYPDARTDRNPPSALTQAIAQPRAATPPRMRHFTFDLSAGAGQRTTQSTPRLAGLCMIRSIAVQPRAVADPPTHGVELGYAQNDVNEPSVANATAKPFTSLMERLVSATGSIAAALRGPVFGTIHTALAGYSGDPNLIVPIPDPIITVTIVNGGGVAGASHTIVVTILENISPEALLNFL